MRDHHGEGDDGKYLKAHLWRVKGGRWMKRDSYFTYLDQKKR